MKKILIAYLIISFMLVNLTGCIGALIIGGAAGALGAYAVGKDTVQGETDKPYDNLWNAALTISRIRGAIKQEDRQRGYIELGADSSKVSIRLIKLTRATTRLKVTSRKHHLPNLDLAQDIFAKIMEQTR